MKPLAILSTGMTTGVGLSTEATCAAIRVGITGFVDTKYMYDGEFIQGCPVPLNPPSSGRQRLIRMSLLSIWEAIQGLLKEKYPIDRVPLILCLSEMDRVGRFAGLDKSLISAIEDGIGQKFHKSSRIIAKGRVGGVHAIGVAREMMLADRGIQRVLLCGVDTYLVTETLDHYYDQRRLLTADNADGFIPGEAAACVLLGPMTRSSSARVVVAGLGFGDEPAPINSEKPLRADGLVSAIRMAMAESGTTYEKLAYRLTDNSGKQYGYKESALVMTRVVRPVKPEFDIEHPSDCVGEIGAAIVPVMLAVASLAEAKSYAPGRFMGDGIFCHVSDDGSSRAAMILRGADELRIEKREFI